MSLFRSSTETKLGLVLEPLAAARGVGRERERRWGGGFVVGGARLVARVPHTHLVPKGHGLVRVLRCDVRHNVLQERGAFSALARRTSGIAPSSANLITAS